ncbi:amidohydrolase [Alkalibacillus aidingensis]|uniref:amidohydrolase n=1 Tax=Alkalibacillus aidingensis TaxID=2747607 RepID=UPI0016604EEB|nr:amidohydrolase [Alkalibacillus aidingensis]
MGNLWYGGTIYTMEEEGHRVNAIYENDGKIMAVGEPNVLREQYPIEQEFKFDGVMLPGFIDSHLHIIGHGERLLRLDLTYSQSREELLKQIETKVKQLEPGEWLVAEGFNENNWDNPKVIHRNELDAISPEHPVVLTRVCRHALVANSKAIEIAGIHNQTTTPEGGVIEYDEDGGLTGYFLDQAQELIKEYMPEADQAYLEKTINTSVNDLLSHGIVSGHTEDLAYYGGFQKTYEAYQNTVGTINNFRAHLLVHHEVVDDFKQAGYNTDQRDDWLEFGAMKIFSDGALGGRTAYLSQPYADDPTTKGVLIHSDEELYDLIKKARAYNMAIAVHAIGDAAVEIIVEILEEIPAPEGKYDRIIHAQIMRPDIIKRLTQLPVILDIQPTFVSSDFPWAIDRVGQDLIETSYPWKTFIREGILCAGGSDAPIEEVAPIRGISAAVNRQSSFDGNVYLPEESLTVFEAISLYTTKPAMVIGKEDRQGKLKPGFFADFVILDQDPFEISASDLERVEVKQTVVGGHPVYNK